MMRGLVSAMYARIVSPVVCGAAASARVSSVARADAPAGPDRRRLRLVEAGDGQADEQREDHRAEPQVERLRPAGQPGQDLQSTDDDLDRVQHGRGDRGAGDRGSIAPGPPGDDREHGHDQPDDGGDPPMEDVRRRGLGEVREERAAHQRPVGEHQRGVRRGDAGAEEQQRERGEGREGRQQREALAPAATGEAGRETGTHRHEHEQCHQQEGRGQVGRDRLPAVTEADGLAAEPRLESDKTDRRDGRPQQRRPVAMIADRQDRQAQDLEADDRRDGPVDPFDPRLRIVEWREQLTVAERPVRAAKTGIGGAHDDADDDQQDRGPERQRGELLEAGQWVSWHRTSVRAGTGTVAVNGPRAF